MVHASKWFFDTVNVRVDGLAESGAGHNFDHPHIAHIANRENRLSGGISLSSFSLIYQATGCTEIARQRPIRPPGVFAIMYYSFGMPESLHGFIVSYSG